MEPKILVIGVGNAWRGDDGIGPAVVERLQDLCLPGVTTHIENRDGLSIYQAWQDWDNVIVVDAMQVPDSPLQGGATKKQLFVRFDAARAPLRRDSFLQSIHAIGVVEAIELARVMNQMPARMTVYGVQGYRFDEGVCMTKAARCAMDAMFPCLLQDIGKILNEP